jgi:heme/copper-type cytochrome/quinol oxidase subunit 1
MSLSPSSTGNIILGLLISGISSCLTSINFWTTILNLRSYYLTLKTMPLFPFPSLNVSQIRFIHYRRNAFIYITNLIRSPSNGLG